MPRQPAIETCRRICLDENLRNGWAADLFAALTVIVRATAELFAALTVIALAAPQAIGASIVIALAAPEAIGATVIAWRTLTVVARLLAPELEVAFAFALAVARGLT